jgi:hypothetical protein
MIELGKVLKVQAMPGYRLMLTFSNGAQGQADLSDMVAEGGQMVEPLREPAKFAEVFVANGVPSWPNGYDIDALRLYQELKARRALTFPALTD